MTDTASRASLYWDELRAKGPATVEDAEKVGGAFCKAAELAMIAGSDRELHDALKEIQMWGHHLYARRRILNEEAKRLEREPLAVRVPLVGIHELDQLVALGKVKAKL